MTTTPPTALSRRAAQFAHMTALLATYAADHDGANPPQHYRTPTGEALGEWVVTQRSRYRGARSKAPLTGAEIAALEAAGIIWAPRRGRGDAASFGASTQQYLVALDGWARKHGHANPPASTVAAGLNLGYWLRNRREEDAKGRLDPDLRAALVALGVQFRGQTPGHALGAVAQAARTRTAAEHFDRMLAKAAVYRAENGDLRVRRSYVDADGTAVGVWLSDQRQARKNGTLSVERVAALDALGMIWQDAPGRRDFDATFTPRLACIAAYEAETGSANPPAAYRCEHDFCVKRDIGQWLHRIRKKYRADMENGTVKLAPEQVLALVEAGVDLDPTGRVASVRPVAA